MSAIRRFLFCLAISFPSVLLLNPVNAIELAQMQPPQAIDGEVTRINKSTNKLTIRHGPMPHLDMPAMTMVYTVKDPAMLDRVKVGSKIRFVGDKVDGQFTVLSIDSVQ